MTQNKKLLSYEYIRGLTDGGGCFTFYPGSMKSSGRKNRIPTFVISMHERDKALLEMVRDTLGLRNKIYKKRTWKGDGYNRGNASTLVVREFDQLKDIIIPLFYKKLKGYKSGQFLEWLEKIGNDPDVTDRFKSLYRLYKWGIYDEQKFLDKFID